MRWLHEQAYVEARQHRKMFAIDALLLSAEAIARGDYVAWCEANPEIPPAPTGADAGRVPGESEE